MFPYHSWLRYVLVCSLCCFTAIAACAADVGTLTGIVRKVEVSTTPGKKSWTTAKLHQTLADGAGVRTKKRSMAEITFADQSVLRINERSDLIVQQAQHLRKVKLTAGAVWLQVTRGAKTSVETPTCTASAKGTAYTVTVNPDGSVRIIVLADAVDVAAGDQRVTVTAGHYVDVSPDGVIGETRPLRLNDLPREYGGVHTGWWTHIIKHEEILISPGLSPVDELRNLPPGDVPRNEMFFSSPSGTDEGNIEVEVDWPETEDPIDPGNIEVEIDWPDQDGDIEVEIDWPDQQGDIEVEIDWPDVESTERFRAKAERAPPYPRDTASVIDRTETSYAVLGAGLLAGVLANRHDMRFTTPDLDAYAYRMSGDTEYFGGRGEVDGFAGRMRYHLTANAIKYSGDPTLDWRSKLDSEAWVEQRIGTGVSLFAGRRQFYGGPVFINMVQSQLIADRYSSVGINASRGKWRGSVAWLYDGDPELDEAQAGGLASITHRIAGGVVGVHLLYKGKEADRLGCTGSFCLPLLRNAIDGYGEVGVDGDGRDISTFGLYIPALYQSANIDLFVEDAHRQGVGHATSLVAIQRVSDSAEGRAFITRLDEEITLGLDAIWYLGSSAAAR